ncbi:MAG: hypothetical protein KDC47_10540, partial [Flavobacteriaceae bacterium]|nr:hypothetical protein [Flavobacteriaceae bacterium]
MYNKNNDLIKATTKTPSLQETHPEIAAEWDYERNGSLKPNMVSAGSHRLAHWKCPKGPDHEWATAIRHRARRGHGCSICANRIVVPSNCLAKTHPNIAKEFYTPMNGVETSLTISAGSNKYFYWKCAQGDDHIWKTSPQKRTLFNSPCPYCNNTKVSTTNSLASNYPHIAAEWDYKKNGELTPDLITTKNMKSVF